MGRKLDVGDVVDDFELADEAGVPRRLTDFLATGPVVLFFYPAAMTAGCTAEACHFRDLGKEFAELGAHRVGISGDAVERQQQFVDKHSLGYPLLSDPDGSVSERFGVFRTVPLPWIGKRRITYVIGPDRSILGVVHSDLSMRAHADRALQILRTTGA